jgi:signal transduction histidine kinase
VPTTNRPLLQLQLRHEIDVVLAQKRTRECARLVQLTSAGQTKFATAVSELCRNVVEHVGVGELRLAVISRPNSTWLEAVVSDHGRGIGNPDYWLNAAVRPGARGRGLANARHLADEFDLRTSAEQGTRITLRQRLPDRSVPLTEAVLQQWRQQLAQDNSVSPYEEVKTQNDHLVRLYEELQQKNQFAEQQIAVVSRLNTELEKLNQANEQLLRERQEHNAFLEQANAELDAFAHTVSHDLKAPLYNIQGLAELISESLATGDLPDIAHSLGLMRQQTDWMNQLIQGILTYARAGRYELQKTTFAVAELVHRVAQSLRGPAGLQLHVADDLPTLHTEAIYLQQIFSNLISNAFKYHDRPTGNVWVTVQYRADHLEFCVADDGPGIRAEDQAHLFEMFQVVSTRPVTDSSGVGLAIVRKIVSDKGGRVWINSGGRGTQFVFTWPLNEVVACPPAVALSPTP